MWCSTSNFSAWKNASHPLGNISGPGKEGKRLFDREMCSKALYFASFSFIFQRKSQCFQDRKSLFPGRLIGCP